MFLYWYFTNYGLLFQISLYLLNIFSHFIQLVQAMEVTAMRGGKFTSIDDVLFLMRNNKVIH